MLPLDPKDRERGAYDECLEDEREICDFCGKPIINGACNCAEEDK